MSELSRLHPAQPDGQALSVPEGYRLFEHGGPYFSSLGAVYARPVPEGRTVFALRIAEQHTNILGVAHGGMLVTLADAAMGTCIGFALAASGRQSGEPASTSHANRQPSVTTTLSTEFLASARVGDWLEAHAFVRRLGRRMVFTDCSLRTGEREVLHASGTFMRIDG
ncbi:PaaI family thioesterase [Paraburkholderia sp. J12]|uniref:PaaI family thioesterase n=1 Tax=Paraburkholderia sp. J12 TaxID=2805432 RepID=UPI002ABE3623|nr:PaaI family thioesterase [Paraburkholderia sp. J12]